MRLGWKREPGRRAVDIGIGRKILDYCPGRDGKEADRRCQVAGIAADWLQYEGHRRFWNWDALTFDGGAILCPGVKMFVGKDKPGTWRGGMCVIPDDEREEVVGLAYSDDKSVIVGLTAGPG